MTLNLAAQMLTSDMKNKQAHSPPDWPENSQGFFHLLFDHASGKK